MDIGNLDDPKNIAGLSSLIEDDVESTMDLGELELEIARGASVQPQESVDVAQEYRKEMDRISRNFDIAAPEPTEVFDDYDVCDTQPTYIGNNDTSPILSRNVYNSPSTDPLESGDHEWQAAQPNDIQLNNMTQEEAKQSRIHSVLRGIDDRELEFNVNKEREEDDRASLLEQIDMLKITLEDDGVDISGVPPISKQSNMKDVHNVYKILRLKNDRNRYCSFAEEIILAGAYGLEYLFDGQNQWFGRKPDLTGWSSTIRVKMRRMRYETSTFVQEVMQEYNMSAGVRLALELIPSMFLYSRNRRITQDDNLASDKDYQDAISRLNTV
jgi:hypothetical protein